MPNYKQIATDARKKVLELIYRAQTSHIGSNFSAIDIMAVLFEKLDLQKDKFILSAGWKAASLYYFLWKKGRITEEELNSYCQEVICPECDGVGKARYREDNLIFYTQDQDCRTCDGTGKVQSKFIGLSEPVHPFISFAGGSMGMGLPAAVGFALSKKLKGEDGNVYCLMSDGELQCGTTWEAALIAVQHKLDNLVIMVDRNKLQAMGKTDDILSVDRTDVWENLGWDLRFVFDGHNFEKIIKQLNETYYKAPIIIFVDTIKGRGVSFMENNNIWHYKAPNEEEYNLALKELNK